MARSRRVTRDQPDRFFAASMAMSAVPIVSTCQTDSVSMEQAKQVTAAFPLVGDGGGSREAKP